MRIKKRSRIAGDCPIKPNGYHYHLVDSTCTDEGGRHRSCNISWADDLPDHLEQTLVSTFLCCLTQLAFSVEYVDAVRDHLAHIASFTPTTLGDPVLISYPMCPTPSLLDSFCHFNHFVRPSLIMVYPRRWQAHKQSCTNRLAIYDGDTSWTLSPPAMVLHFTNHQLVQKQWYVTIDLICTTIMV